MRSIFVLCFTGDYPFQKRIIDAWASVAIPVVVVRQFDGGQSYFFNSKSRNQPTFQSINTSYPSLPNGVLYSDLVVELEPEVLSEKRLMEYLEGIPTSVIEEKLKNIERVRTWFLYDFDGTTEDGFSVLLGNIEKWVLSTG